MTELKIAIRYIFSKHSFNFITIINFISLIGIMIGVAALIIVLSIFNAFQHIAVKQIVGYDPHIKIEKINSLPNFDSWISSNLSFSHQIESKTKISEARIICFKGGVSRTANLNTVDMKDFRYFSNFEQNLVMGSLELQNQGNIPTIIIGAILADNLQTLVGDTLYITTPAQIEISLLNSTFPNSMKVIVSGIFQTNVKDYDYNYIFGLFPLAKYLLGDSFEKSINYQIRLKDINQLDNFFQQLKNTLTKTYSNAEISNWKELNKDYYNVMKFEKMSTTFILGLIILVAIFNVFASLTMTILEKKKDISVIRAMGGEKKFIQKIYLYEGLFVGFIGSIMGGILGLALCYAQINFKWFKIDNSKYIMDSIPILIKYEDVIAVVVLSFIMAIVATIYPARKSGNIDIIENLREE